MFTDNRWGEKDQHRISLSNGDYGEVLIWFEEEESTNPYGICDHNFDLVDAHAICKTLGYTRASNFRTDSYYSYSGQYGYGYRYYGITDLDCDANSQSLNDCQYTKLDHRSYENCRTDKDHVGVTCVGKLNWS